jgi:pyruvate kinase
VSQPPVSLDERADALRKSLLSLIEAIDAEAAAQAARIEAVLPKHRASATNLAHYIGLRKQDIHRLQLELAAVGLSSLGRCEGHVRDTLQRLVAWLSGARSEAMTPETDERLDWARAERILHANTRALFGPRPRERHVYIMVTAPKAEEATGAWADALLKAGADILRINGAHESPAEWKSIAATFKARAYALGKPGRVVVDLPGPKLRVDIVQPESAVLHLKRVKDRLGRTLVPTSVDLVAEFTGGAQLPVPPHWIPLLRPGDVITMTDPAQRERVIAVEKSNGTVVQGRCDRSLYLTPGRPLAWQRSGVVIERGRSGPLGGLPGELRLNAGDRILLNASGLTRDPDVAALAFPDAPLLAQVRAGERAVLDDGRVVAVAEAARDDGLLCRIERAVKSPTRLRSGKGISFPDSELVLGQLGPQDEAALAFALEHADGVNVSFVNSPADVAVVARRLREAGKPGFGMTLKLETRAAMRNLPEILFEALQYDPVGIMIARGDLAVELSFERLAEMQEELLWFGEACHVPVIWATQVLDTVAHTGLPTRAEITDAAMSMRAECVMLNRGPYLPLATQMLADIICKMEAHQYKKRSLYRRLSLAHGQRAGGKAAPAAAAAPVPATAAPPAKDEYEG